MIHEINTEQRSEDTVITACRVALIGFNFRKQNMDTWHVLGVKKSILLFAAINRFHS